MEELLKLPQSPLGIFGMFIGSVFIILTFVGKRRSSDLDTLRQSNDDLRASIADKGAEITVLRADIKELRAEVATLQGSNNTLQEIVNNALKEYLSENPDVVLKLNSGATVVTTTTKVK